MLKRISKLDEVQVFGGGDWSIEGNDVRVTRRKFFKLGKRISRLLFHGAKGKWSKGGGIPEEVEQREAKVWRLQSHDKLESGQGTGLDNQPRRLGEANNRSQKRRAMFISF